MSKQDPLEQRDGHVAAQRGAVDRDEGAPRSERVRGGLGAPEGKRVQHDVCDRGDHLDKRALAALPRQEVHARAGVDVARAARRGLLQHAAEALPHARGPRLAPPREQREVRVRRRDEDAVEDAVVVRVELKDAAEAGEDDGGVGAAVVARRGREAVRLAARAARRRGSDGRRNRREPNALVAEQQHLLGVVRCDGAAVAARPARIRGKHRLEARAADKVVDRRLPPT